MPFRLRLYYKASHHSVDYTCGRRGTILLHAEEGCHGLLFRCTGCGSYNVTEDRTDARRRTSGGGLARRERDVFCAAEYLNGYLPCPERQLRNSGTELGFWTIGNGYPEAVMRGSTLNSNSYNPAFDPETTAAMATALEQVCKALRIKGNYRAAGHRNSHH